MAQSKFVTSGWRTYFLGGPDCGPVEDSTRIKPTYALSITLPLAAVVASLFAMSSHSRATQSCRYRVTRCRRDLRVISHLDKFLQNKSPLVRDSWETRRGSSCILFADSSINSKNNNISIEYMYNERISNFFMECYVGVKKRFLLAVFNIIPIY